ncbi:MAG TPA: amidohydrolase family protein [Frankiaceae bacterium]|jgi:predicted TIM-barrel fold metal-dependent hydrolase|nr:amidohydrolase family protein [Frankiaceae bacterium]
MTVTEVRQKQIVISGDGHAGADIHDYKPYLERRYHEEFDAWSGTYKNPFSDLVRAGRDRNWDTAVRQRDLEADGVVAEVLFPNTVPPFFSSGSSLIMLPPTAEEYEHKWAGLKAHNRWMVDFCSEVPGRRAGIAQILLNDVDDAVAEIRWAKNAGLTGGILLPGVPPGFTSDIAPVYAEKYEPIWRTCAELEMPLNNHGGSGAAPFGAEPAARAVALVEIPFYSHRSMWHLMFAGVFERYPNLKMVLTEQGTGWVPGALATLDEFFLRYHTEGGIESLIVGPGVDGLRRRPSEYFAENCYVCASNTRFAEMAIRRDVGVDRIMWGADYPHVEGSVPHTMEALRYLYADIPADEQRQILADTAIDCYGFDRELLQTAANQIGPSLDELSVHLDASQIPADSTCNTFDTRAIVKAW